MTLPVNLFLIGGQKCGTTKLADLLALHPDICLQTDKESAYYGFNYSKGQDWYYSRFLQPERRYCLDASVTYTEASLNHDLHAETVAKRIFDDNPAAKFIYILRDPVERTYSAYLHTVRHQHESRPFEQALEKDSSYLDTSNYAGQLALFLEHFSLDRFLILKYSELQASPETLLLKCYSFLDLEPYEVPTEDLHSFSNKGFQFSGPGHLLRMAFKSNDTFKTWSNRAKRVIPKGLQPLVASVITKENPSLTPTQRTLIEEKLKGRTLELEMLTGMDFSNW